jgi:Fic family protein
MDYNGNGRLARLIADLLITQQGGIPFSWGMHQDLHKTTLTRQRYIKALQDADKGNYAALLAFARS